MLLRPRLADLKLIGLYTGKVLIGFGYLMALPLLVSLLFGEWNPAVEFVVGMGACFALGLLLSVLCQTTHDLSWGHGLVVASCSWFFAMVLSAIPPYLSGHFGSFLDACFDMMSGLTTTGLLLICDLDHVSLGLNTWRHLVAYVGGQGLVVLAITFLFRGTAGAYKAYVGEAKDERLMPNVIQTARAIWLVSVGWLLVGTAALYAVALGLGLGPVRGFLHALWGFLGSWSTCGFAPMSYNASYYHSLAWEGAMFCWMMLGAVNFALHWAVWTGDRKEIRRNIEMVSFFVTMTLGMVITAVGLMQAGIYPEEMAFFRKMFFQVLSGHTGTGYATIYSRAFITQWNEFALMGMMLVMAVGGAACSTAGGFKGLRMGIIAKSMAQDLKRIISPESARVPQRWHHIRDRVLEEGMVKGAVLIVLSYVGIYALGALAGVLYGYPLLDSLFDSISAGANVGLSCGVTSPAMPTGLKATYIFTMWAGRLEFMSLYALLGYLWALLRGR